MTGHTPVEGLSREHGLLRRLLIVCRKISRRIGHSHVSSELYEAAEEAAGIARLVAVEYHQLSEDTYVFPALAGTSDFSRRAIALRKQHKAAECAVNEILELAARPSTAANRRLSYALSRFAEMYDSHLAWEDSVLFPAFVKRAEPGQYSELGKRLAEIEERKLGANGFEKTLAKINGMEKTLGIVDLSGYTYKLITR